MDDPEYLKEIGAPQILDSDFHKNQRLSIAGRVQTEIYLPQWAGFARLPDMKVSSSAKVKMETLEGKWTVILGKSSGQSLVGTDVSHGAHHIGCGCVGYGRAKLSYAVLSIITLIKKSPSKPPVLSKLLSARGSCF